jgi:hypothetical protein
MNNYKIYEFDSHFFNKKNELYNKKDTCINLIRSMSFVFGVPVPGNQLLKSVSVVFLIKSRDFAFLPNQSSKFSFGTNPVFSLSSKEKIN